MSAFNGATLMITGGTGSFGNTVLKLPSCNAKLICHIRLGFLFHIHHPQHQRTLPRNLRLHGRSASPQQSFHVHRISPSLSGHRCSGVAASGGFDDLAQYLPWRNGGYHSPLLRRGLPDDLHHDEETLPAFKGQFLRSAERGSPDRNRRVKQFQIFNIVHPEKCQVSDIFHSLL